MQGHEGDYWWADRLGEVLELLDQFPKIVVGRRVVIAAYDSGPLPVSEEELRRGWRQAGDVVVTTVIASFDDIAGAVSDEYSELWIYAADEPIPDFSTWNHFADQVRVITLADPVIDSPDGPATWDAGLVRADRQHLASLQQRLRAGLRTYRPLTFLRDDLIVTRDFTAIAALQNRLELAERCQCRARGDAAWVQPSVDEFTAPYDLIERSTSQWNALYRCHTCGAFWVIDNGPGIDQPMMVAKRIHSARDWQLTDLVDARRQLLLAGAKESDRPCRWAGCPRRALKDRQICVDHAYNLHPRAAHDATEPTKK